MGKRVSIIIPCYNAQSYIKKCIESIVSQTIGFENIELIIIDDASTDLSLEFILEYKNYYPDNIVVISLNVNKGQGNARNIGICQASAQYLIFVDADDWLDYTMCEKLVGKAEYYQCDMVECGYVMHCGEQIQKHKIVKKEKYFKINKVDERKHFISENIFCGGVGRSCYKTDFLRKNHIEFKHFDKYEDNYFSGIVEYKVNSYCALPDTLYHYRMISGSNSRIRNDLNHFVRLDIELEKILYYQQNGLYNIYYDIIRKSFLDNFYLNTLHIIFCQFDDIPIEMITTMHYVVRELYPDYIEYCMGSKITGDYMILLIAFDFPIETWERIKAAYLKNILYGSSDELVWYIESLKNFWGIDSEKS